MAQINIGKAPSNHAVLPFYATGGIAFFMLCFFLFISADSFTGHYFSPHILTMVHVAALGWGTMVIFGAAYQLLPVICEKDLFSEKLASLSWYTLTTGSAMLAFSFWDFRAGWIMIGSGILVVLSVIFYGINVWMTSDICKKYSLQKLYVISSGTWLLFTTLAGLLLAINLKNPFFEKNHMDILKLHAHAGLAGWFLQLIAGVSSKLIPMFLLGKSSKANLLKYAWVLQNAALVLFLADGYFLGFTSRIYLYLFILLAGIGLWLGYLYDAWRNRIRKKLELLMKHTLISFMALILAILMIPVIMNTVGHQWTMLYGTLLFMGWISGIILGKTFKTLPFIVWNDHYKNLSGKVKVPLPKQLYYEKLIPVQFWLFIAALLSLAVAMIVQDESLLRFAGFLWLILAGVYCLNLIKIMTHKPVLPNQINN